MNIIKLHDYFGVFLIAPIVDLSIKTALSRVTLFGNDIG